jgi:hypothetical protein
MIPLFLGLTLANLLMLSGAFALGLAVSRLGDGVDTHAVHLAMGLGAALGAAMTHCVVYTYFMATTKWLEAACDKAGLDRERFVLRARAAKSRSFRYVMLAILSTMVAAFGGAATDTVPGWPAHLHLTLASLALLANACSAVAQWRLIRARQALMDEALARVNAPPGVALLGPTGTEPITGSPTLQG